MNFNVKGQRLNVKGSRGFTLVEILIAIAILAVILSLGLFISFDFYRKYAFSSEKNIILSVLQKARSQSMNNIDEKQHGVHFFLDTGNNNTLTYTVFECSSPCTEYPGSNNSDFSVAASYKSSMSTPNLPFDVIFNQLNGDCVVSTGANPFNCDPVNQQIILNDGSKTYNITVNSEGRIDWQ